MPPVFPQRTYHVANLRICCELMADADGSRSSGRRRRVAAGNNGIRWLALASRVVGLWSRRPFDEISDIER